MAADKFEVLSCVRQCSQLLTSLMTTKSALLCLDHRCSISMTPEVQRVTGAAKQFLAKKYRDFGKSYIKVKKFPLAGIEAIFSSSDLLVTFEDNIYFFLREWARARYRKSDERRKILSSRLLPLVHFSHMTDSALQHILTCTDTDIDHELVTKRVISEVLLHKGYPAQLEGAHAAGATTAERAYTHKPMKVVAFDQPCRQVIVYWDLTRHDCSLRFFPGGVRISSIFSHDFHLVGQQFYLNAMCIMDEENKVHRFGLLLGRNPTSTCITVDYEFAARTGLSGKFVSYFDSKLTFTGDPGDDLLPKSFVSVDDSLFINDALHLRADITIVEQPVLQT